MSALLIGFCVAISVGGLTVAWSGLTGPPRNRERSLVSGKRPKNPMAYLLAAAVFMVCFALTQRFVVAGGAASMIVVIPNMFETKKQRKLAIAKQLACAEFADMVHRSLSAGGNIGAALQQAAEHPPPLLAEELAQFHSEQQGLGVDRKASLVALARRTNEPAMNFVVAQLIVADNEGAGDLTSALKDISRSTRDFARARSATQTERAQREFQAQLLGIIIVLGALAASLYSPDITAAYDRSVTGQLLLMPAVLMFIGGWVGLTRLNKVDSQRRFELAEENL